MHLHNETADLAGIGGSVVSNAVAARNYFTRPETSTTDYAVACLATRFRLTISTARLVCHLSGIGGVL